jgi:hypothetical protein
MLAKRILLACLAGLVVGTIGCAPNYVSSEGGTYQWGTLYAVTNKDMDSVYAATLFAMDKLQLQVTNKMKDAFGAKVIAKSADGKIIVVKIKPPSDNKTGYQIHAGAFWGDEEKARKIYAEIGNGLAAVKTK